MENRELLQNVVLLMIRAHDRYTITSYNMQHVCIYIYTHIHARTQTFVYIHVHKQNVIVINANRKERSTFAIIILSSFMLRRLVTSGSIPSIWRLNLILNRW